MLTDLNFKILIVEPHTLTFNSQRSSLYLVREIKGEKGIVYKRIVCVVITQFLLNFQVFFLFDGLM